MESMRQCLPATLDIAAPDLALLDMGVEKCPGKFGDSLSSRPLNEIDAIPETSDAGCYSESAWAGSEDSACSLESEASSNAISSNSLASDADSLAIGCEGKIVDKCPSGSSIVTYDEAVSKVKGEGECKAAGDRQHTRRANRCQTDAHLDEQDTSVNTAPRMAGSVGKAWTDDKHCSYLNSIEATFVRSLYEQDYRAIDMSDQDQDCVESRPMAPNYITYGRGELFTSLQRGCYDQREYYRPHYIFAPSAPTVLASPWIQHFNPRIAIPSGVGGASQEVFAGHTSSSGFAEGVHGYQGVKEEVMESAPAVPDVLQGAQGWTNRYQSQVNVSGRSPVRPDLSTLAKKRTCNLEPCSDVMYRPKKLKSTQKKLAETDLELEEQFVLKQLSQKEDGNRASNRDGGCRLDGYSDLRKPSLEEHEANDDQLPQSGQRGVTSSNGVEIEDPLADGKDSNAREQEDDRKRGESQVEHGNSETVSRPSAESDNREDCLTQTNVLECSGQYAGGVQDKGATVNAVELVTLNAAGTKQKAPLEEVNVRSQADLGYDAQDDCNFVANRSPRSYRTYTWGLMGTRRPLLSGSAKDSREDEITAKDTQ